MANESPDPVERLRQLLVGGASPESPTELDACYSLVEEEALDLVYGGDRGRLDEFWRRIRRVYEVLAAQSPDDYEKSPLYHLGRVVELVELLAVAAEQAHPAEVMELLGREGCRELLALLKGAPRTSKELEAKLGWEKSRLSRRLKRLGELGLVISRRSGVVLVSQLTPLGAQALRDGGDAPPEPRRAASCWQTAQLARPVAVP